MKKLFLYFVSLTVLSGCTLSNEEYVYSLSVEFLEPTEWNGRTIPPNQSCRSDGGKGNTPPLYVSDIPQKTNLLIMEINDLDNPALSENGGLGSIGFYHNPGEHSAVLLPIPGETNDLPSFAFKEKASRVNAAKPYPYTPPCIERKHHYSLTIKAVNRTGSFDKQKTVLLGEGRLYLGKY